jgi:hypothetical protein
VQLSKSSKASITSYLSPQRLQRRRIYPTTFFSRLFSSIVFSLGVVVVCFRFLIGADQDLLQNRFQFRFHRVNGAEDSGELALADRVAIVLIQNLPNPLKRYPFLPSVLVKPMWFKSKSDFHRASLRVFVVHHGQLINYFQKNAQLYDRIPALSTGDMYLTATRSLENCPQRGPISAAVIPADPAYA